MASELLVEAGVEVGAVSTFWGRSRGQRSSIHTKTPKKSTWWKVLACVWMQEAGAEVEVSLRASEDRRPSPTWAAAIEVLVSEVGHLGAVGGGRAQIPEVPMTWAA